jgi:hypothetical protein
MDSILVTEPVGTLDLLHFGKIGFVGERVDQTTGKKGRRTCTAYRIVHMPSPIIFGHVLEHLTAH